MSAASQRAKLRIERSKNRELSRSEKKQGGNSPDERTSPELWISPDPDPNDLSPARASTMSAAPLQSDGDAEVPCHRKEATIAWQLYCAVFCAPPNRPLNAQNKHQHTVADSNEGHNTQHMPMQQSGGDEAETAANNP